MQIVWYDGQRGRWDHGLLMGVFEKYPTLFPQHNSKELLYTDKNVIVIVSGRPDMDPLLNYLKKLKGGVIILTSEEDAYFDWKALPHHFDLWTQYYSASKEGIKTRLLMGAPNRLANYKINSHLPKKYLWSFIGQVQNPSRQACTDVLKKLPDGFLHMVEAFGGQGNGIEYQEYLDICCQSKFVICPGGSMSVDSFRLYEAMECGAIPITEKRAPRDKGDFNYWKEVYPEHEPITVDNWKQLPELMQTLEANNDWWFDYKAKFERKLLDLCNQ